MNTLLNEGDGITPLNETDRRGNKHSEPRPEMVTTKDAHSGNALAGKNPAIDQSLERMARMCQHLWLGDKMLVVIRMADNRRLNTN